MAAAAAATTPGGGAAAGAGVDEASALLFAAESGAVSSLQRWVARGGDLNAPLPSGWTPLQLAAFHGHATAVRALLEAGARGARASHIAARQGHTAALEALLEFGTDPDAPDEYGQSALHYAAAFGHIPVIRQLLRYGASPMVVESSGRTPCDLALAAGYRDAAALLAPPLPSASLPPHLLAVPSPAPRLLSSSLPRSAAGGPGGVAAAWLVPPPPPPAAAAGGYRATAGYDGDGSVYVTGSWPPAPSAPAPAPIAWEVSAAMPPPYYGATPARVTFAVPPTPPPAPPTYAVMSVGRPSPARAPPTGTWPTQLPHPSFTAAGRAPMLPPTHAATSGGGFGSSRGGAFGGDGGVPTADVPREAPTVALAATAASQSGLGGAGDSSGGGGGAAATWHGGGSGTVGGAGLVAAHTTHALECALTSCGCAPGRVALRSWLSSLGLGHMFVPLVVCGFDDLRFLAATGLSEADVAAAAAAGGVSLAPGHVRKLVTLFGASEHLPPDRGDDGSGGSDEDGSGSEDEEEGSDDGSNDDSDEDDDSSEGSDDDGSDNDEDDGSEV